MKILSIVFAIIFKKISERKNHRERDLFTRISVYVSLIIGFLVLIYFLVDLYNVLTHQRAIFLEATDKFILLILSCMNICAILNVKTDNNLLLLLQKNRLKSKIEIEKARKELANLNLEDK